ncbi:MAG: hypothetical protein AB3N13_16830 [Arenibacterium sp.]
MTNRYGPSKGELKFRLYASIAGLALMIGALMFKGIPSGPAFFEVVVVAGGFFGGSALWTARKLIKQDHPEDGSKG